MLHVGGVVTDAVGPKVSILVGFLGTPTAGLLFAVSGPDRGAGALPPASKLIFQRAQ